MALSQKTLLNMVTTVRALTPVIVVHPDNEQVVREALAAANGLVEARVEVNALEETGALHVFQGKRFDLDLGRV